jgi:hypothetical protein
MLIAPGSAPLLKTMTGKFPIFILFLCLAALAPLSASAAAWQALPGSRGVSIEVDKSSMDRSGKTVKAWTKASYADIQQASAGDFFFSSYKSLAQYDCAARTVKLLFKVYYAEDGSEVTSVRYTEFDKPAQVVPDTAEEQVLEFACSYKPEAAKPAGKKKSARKRKAKAKEDKAEAEKTATSPASQQQPAAAKQPQPAEPAKGGAAKPGAPAKPPAAPAK